MQLEAVELCLKGGFGHKFPVLMTYTEPQLEQTQLHCPVEWCLSWRSKQPGCVSSVCARICWRICRNSWRTARTRKAQCVWMRLTPLVRDPGLGTRRKVLMSWTTTGPSHSSPQLGILGILGMLPWTALLGGFATCVWEFSRSSVSLTLLKRYIFHFLGYFFGVCVCWGLQDRAGDWKHWAVFLLFLQNKCLLYFFFEREKK